MTLTVWIGMTGLIVASLACDSQAPTSPTDLARALAPIEQVDINVAESFPPQYFVAIVSLQPNSYGRRVNAEGLFVNPGAGWVLARFLGTSSLSETSRPFAFEPGRAWEPDKAVRTDSGRMQ